MNFWQYMSDALSALTAAGVIAVVAWAYSWARNLRLEYSLKGAINPNGVGIEFSLSPLSAKFTIQIHNYTSAYVRVRSVVLISDRGQIELSPKKNQQLFQTPLSNEMLRPKFRRTFISRGALQEDNNPHSQLLPPKTMGIWEVWPGAIGQYDRKLVHGFVAFEYGTVFGNAALVRMQIPEVPFKLIKECFEELNTCYRERRPLPGPDQQVTA
jgi:hypothetical protein